MLKQGDIVLNPNDHGKNTCVILRITNGKAILTPFTVSGYPSVNARNWLSADLDTLIQSKKWAHIETCPECVWSIGASLSEEDIGLIKILDEPLRWPNIYEPKMQCKRCKKWFEKECG